MKNNFKTETKAISYGLPIAFFLNLLQSIFFAVFFHKYINTKYASFLYLEYDISNAFNDDSSDDFEDLIDGFNIAYSSFFLFFGFHILLGKELNII